MEQISWKKKNVRSVLTVFKIVIKFVNFLVNISSIKIVSYLGLRRITPVQHVDMSCLLMRLLNKLMEITTLITYLDNLCRHNLPVITTMVVQIMVAIITIVDLHLELTYLLLPIDLFGSTYFNSINKLQNHFNI